MRIKLQAGLHLCKLVGYAVRTAPLRFGSRFRCARRTLRFLRLNLGRGHAFRSRAALTDTSPADSCACCRDPGENSGLADAVLHDIVIAIGNAFVCTLIFQDVGMLPDSIAQ